MDEWKVCNGEKAWVSAVNEEFNEAYILSLKGNYGSFFSASFTTLELNSHLEETAAVAVAFHHRKSTCWKIKFIASHESFSIIIL